MRVALAFQNERLDLDVPADRLVGNWQGPTTAPAADPFACVRQALEQPRDYPPLRQAVVPGDRVVIAFDPRTPAAEAVLAATCEVIQKAGVALDAVTVVTPSAITGSAPAGVTVEVHDPENRTELAYLSTTSNGQRVYLNRRVTDADFVLPVGRLGYDPVLGYCGPWSAVFPDLSDAETQRASRAQPGPKHLDPAHPTAALRASAEVSWLLGSQFHVAALGSARGLAEVIAGLESAVRADGMQALDRLWSFEASSRAEVVVAGVGEAGRTTTIEELAEGLTSAARLVERGGKIVVLSRTEGTFGPALQRLMGDDERKSAAALRGHESDRDYVAARQIAQALDWADVYLLSALPSDDVEDLSIIPLDRPEEAQRLVAKARSCIVLSQAERTRARVAGEAEGAAG